MLQHDPAAFEGFQENALRNHKRNLQAGDVLEFQKVTIDGCLFENNRHGPNTELTQDGMIHIADASNELTVINTIFRNNSFTKPVDGVSAILLYIHTMVSFERSSHGIFISLLGQWFCGRIDCGCQDDI